MFFGRNVDIPVDSIGVLAASKRLDDSAVVLDGSLPMEVVTKKLQRLSHLWHKRIKRASRHLNQTSRTPSSVSSWQMELTGTRTIRGSYVNALESSNPGLFKPSDIAAAAPSAPSATSCSSSTHRNPMIEKGGGSSVHLSVGRSVHHSSDSMKTRPPQASIPPQEVKDAVPPYLNDAF
jgi:hypothetical protein